MKTTCLSLLLAIIIYSCTQSVAKGRDGVELKTAMEYNDYIVDRQFEVLTFFDKLSAASAVSVDSASLVIGECEKKTAEFVKDIQQMSDFKGDTIFRNKSVEAFRFYNRLFKEDYRQLLELNNKEDASLEDYTKVEEIEASLARDAAEYDKRFLNAQADFAEKFKLRLDYSKADSLEKE